MIDLPPLPEPDVLDDPLDVLAWSAMAMRTYGEACARAALEAAAQHVEGSFHGYDDERPSPEHWADAIRALKVEPTSATP